jgi:phosphoribosylformylglycinamidine synthase subunit PurQ / glutaminase
MSAVPALVIAGPGTNRDRDLALAFELAGAAPTIVLVDELVERPEMLREARMIGIAGGFSYGDSLGAGRMLALDLMSRIGDELREFVATGRPVIGVCNGFQALTRSKLLPGSLGHNIHGRFECRWVVLEPQPKSRCLWTKGLDDPIHCPIAHGEGRYVHPDPATLAEAGQVALRYRSTNPNGSVADIAGVCNPAGNVLGLMPHPENFIAGRQHPHHVRGVGLDHLGLAVFRNGAAAAAEM